MRDLIPNSLRRRIGREHLLSRGLCEGYTVLFALVHILYFRNGFFDINRCKYYLLVYGALAAAGLCGVCLCIERFWKEPDMLYARRRPMSGPIGAVLLVLACIVSVCISNDPLAAITGSAGRYAGGLCIGAMCVLYACRLWAQGPVWPAAGALALSGGLCALLGVLNFLRFDPLNFYVPSLQEIYHNDFISTIGNINFFSAYMCLIMGLCAGWFLKAQKKTACLLLVPYALGVMGLLAARSESGFMGFAAIFLGMCIGKMRSMREAGRAFVLLGTFALSALLLAILVYHRGGETMELYAGIATSLLHAPWLLVGLAVFCAAAAAFFFTRRETPENARRLRILQNVLVCLAALVVAAVVALMVYFTAFDTASPLSGAAGYLRMDNHWGTFRGFIWKKTLVLYEKLPLVHKLFGIGPDSLKPLLVEHCYDEMVQLTGILFDNAHNEYLQLLITTGAVGLAGYLLMVAGAMCSLRRRMHENPVLFGCFLALCAHLVQSVCNIAQPETTPAVFLLLAIGAGTGRKKADS